MFKFVPQTIPHNIFVIGCGGTGSRLVPMLVQFIRSISMSHSKQGWLMSPRIFLIDDDIVEEKNLLRQNFVASDVGKNKAAVLASRYSKAYGIEVYSINKRITNLTSLKEGMDTLPLSHDLRTVPASSGFEGNLQIINDAMIIMCVDSMKARRDIIRTFHEVQYRRNAYRSMSGAEQDNPMIIPKFFFIDAGNEDSFGQVNFFNAILLQEDDVSKVLEYRKNVLPEHITDEVTLSFMPIDSAHYMNTEDMPGQGSCADLDQTLAINALMATNILGIVQNYYYRKPMKYNQVTVSLEGNSYVSFNNLTHFMVKFVKGMKSVIEAQGKLFSKAIGERHWGRRSSIVYQCFSIYEDVLYPLANEIQARLDSEAKLKEDEAKKEARAKAKEAKAKAKAGDAVVQSPSAEPAPGAQVHAVIVEARAEDTGETTRSEVVIPAAPAEATVTAI